MHMEMQTITTVASEGTRPDSFKPKYKETVKVRDNGEPAYQSCMKHQSPLTYTMIEPCLAHELQSLAHVDAQRRPPHSRKYQKLKEIAAA